MAKFTNKDLRLKDGQKVTWGDSLDANIWWNGPAFQLSVDTTISGIDPTQDYHLATKKYVDDEIALMGGPSVSDHGNLSGLGDDDHTQYILVDGTRGFANTVSGVYPINDGDLATKEYVDGASSGIAHKGRLSIPNEASSITISFSDIGHTNYTVNAIMENTTDPTPSIYMYTVTAKTSSSFTIIFTGDMDSANYIINWMLIVD